MAESILQKSGGTDLDMITAVAADVRKGKVVVDKEGEPVTGAMPENSSPTATLNCGQSKIIPAGYNPGGTVTANSLASQTAGNLAANKIIKGYYGWSNGAKVEGNITVSSVVSFSVAAYSTSQVLCTWKNPAKGPYSGVAICAKTGGYPANINDNRKYTGVGSNSVLNGTSTATIGGLTAGTTYYFRIWVYCTCSAGDLYSGYLQATCAPTAHGRQAFTSSGVFTVPANVRSIDVHCTGGGAGGVSGRWMNASDQCGGGGGGGGYTSYKLSIPATPGEKLTVTVGAGGERGRGGTQGINPNSAGKPSSIARGTSVLCSANGAKASGSNAIYGAAKGGDGGSAGGGGITESNAGAHAAGGGSNGGGANMSWATLVRVYGNGTGQGTTTYEFGNSSLTLYSGGGGGGCSYGSSSQPNARQDRAPGGAGGGGKGGKRYNDTPSESGGFGTGGGGGGGSLDTYSGIASAYGSAGGSGNVIIRW